MNNKFYEIQELLQARAEVSARLSQIPYDGTLEIKTIGDKQYLYLRKRVLGKNTSTYIGLYNQELFLAISDSLKSAKAYKKELKEISKKLYALGYKEFDLSPDVLLNIDFARVNLKSNIYDQAILEGIATTFPDTESIIDNGKVTGMSTNDIQKILNLKHAWEFIMDKDVLSYPSDFAILSNIAKLVNEGFYAYGGRIRVVQATIGGTSYVPKIPNEEDIINNINKILSTDCDIIDQAIELCLYCMKTQIFNDGNKRAAVIFANHFLISKGCGLLVIPEKEVSKFKKLLVNYYEDKGTTEIKQFMRNICFKKIK